MTLPIFVHQQVNPIGACNDHSRKTHTSYQEFTSCRFLGITNGGQFCYNVVFHVKGGTDSTKIFLTYNPAKDQVIADYHLTELA